MREGFDASADWTIKSGAGHSHRRHLHDQVQGKRSGAADDFRANSDGIFAPREGDRFSGWRPGLWFDSWPLRGPVLRHTDADLGSGIDGRSVAISRPSICTRARSGAETPRERHEPRQPPYSRIFAAATLHDIIGRTILDAAAGSVVMRVGSKIACVLVAWAIRARPGPRMDVSQYARIVEIRCGFSPGSYGHRADRGRIPVAQPSLAGALRRCAKRAVAASTRTLPPGHPSEAFLRTRQNALDQHSMGSRSGRWITHHPAPANQLPSTALWKMATEQYEQVCSGSVKAEGSARSAARPGCHGDDGRFGNYVAALRGPPRRALGCRFNGLWR